MEILARLQQHLPSFAIEIVRLNVWLMLLMIVFVPLEKVCALHPQKLLRKGITTDLAYYFLSGVLPKMLLVVPMTLIAWGLHHVTPHTLQLQAATMPLWVRLPAALVVGEIGFYWGHRWAHEVPLLWRFHAVHHSADELDWLVNTRAHPLDIVFIRLCGLVPMYVLGLAQPVSGNRLDVVPLLIMFLGTLWGFFIHSNVNWRFGWIEWLVSTPAFHHWHHTNDEYINKNYSSMLPLVDKLFGTCHVPAKQWPATYGIDDAMPSSLVGQLVQPILREANARTESPAPIISSSEKASASLVPRELAPTL